MLCLLTDYITILSQNNWMAPIKVYIKYPYIWACRNVRDIICAESDVNLNFHTFPRSGSRNGDENSTRYRSSACSCEHISTKLMTCECNVRVVLV